MSGGKGFVQFKTEHLWPHWGCLADCPAACRVIFWMLAHSNRWNYVTAEQSRIMKGTKLSRKSLYRALAFLEERKFLVRSGKTVILNELMTWHNVEPLNPHMAKAMAEPVIPEKRPKQVAAKKRKAA